MQDLALKIDILMLGVGDVERATAFYTEKLGLKPVGRFEEFAFFDAGGIRLCLSGDLFHARRSSGKEPVEIVFGVASVQGAYGLLRTRGVEFLSLPHIVDGSNFVSNFEDLDGHLLSLFGPP